MPVIRGESNVVPLSADRRRSLLAQLKHELAGKATDNGPVIFQIPLEQSKNMDVLVVWHEWENVSSEDRTELILESYGDEHFSISQALGVTYTEAIEQHLLPYSVVPNTRPDEVSPSVIREAMLSEGGIPLSQHRVDLRFPSQKMAEAARKRLQDKVPRGSWAVSWPVASIP